MTEFMARLGGDADRDQFIERVKELQKERDAQEEPTGQKLLDKLRKAVDDAMMKIYWDIQRDALKAADRLKGPIKAVGLESIIEKGRYKDLPRMGFCDGYRDLAKREEAVQTTTHEAGKNVRAERTQSILRETLTVIDAAERAAELIGCELTIQTLEYKDYGTTVAFTIRKIVVPTDDKYKDSFGPAISEDR